MKRISYEELEEILYKITDAEMDDFIECSGGHCDTVSKTLKHLHILGYLDESKIIFPVITPKEHRQKSDKNAMV